MTEPKDTKSTKSILDFAGSVRGYLSDLTSDEVEDLTDGLEADLAEQAAEQGDDFQLGDAKVYALELRNAAGLQAKPRENLFGRLDSLRLQTIARVNKNPKTKPTMAFLKTLTPLWWVMRGTLSFLVLQSFLVGHFFDFTETVASTPRFFLFVEWAAAVVVSVQWGRGFWAKSNLLTSIRKISTVVALLALFPALQIIQPGSITRTISVYRHTNIAPVQHGVFLDGEAVENIFAYDADGNPLTNVQLFDENGKPLNSAAAAQDPGTFAISINGSEAYLAPNARAPWLGGWNVFPLGYLIPEDFDTEKPTARTALPPFLVANKLAPEASLAPTGSPAPSASATAPNGGNN